MTALMATSDAESPVRSYCGKLIRDTADKTPDGRRTLINPKKALQRVEEKSAA